MARKRGGLAGVWDRNKKIIKPLATLTAGALTGGLGGAVVGGLMNGLDREGKGGIGFDVKKGAVGAAQGYGMGKLGAAAKGKAMGLFTGGAKGASSSALGAGPQVTDVTSRIASAVPEQVSRVNPSALFSAAPGPSNASMLGRVGDFVTKNQGLISGAGKAVSGVMGQQAERDQYGDQLDLQRQRFELEREEAMRERERRERVARLLMPLFNQQASELNMGRG